MDSLEKALDAARSNRISQVLCLFPLNRVSMEIVEAESIQKDSIMSHEGKPATTLKHTAAAHGEVEKFIVACKR